MMKISIFDLDGTLISTNSTDAIVNAIPAPAIKKLLHICKVFIFSKVFKKVSKRSLHLCYLKTFTFDVLEETCKQVFDKISYDEQVLALFKKEKKAGRKVVLGTSAISPFADLVAKQLDFDACISCDVRHEANKIVDIEDDVAGAKIDKAREIFDVRDLQAIKMVSDNKEDFLDEGLSYDSLYIHRGSRSHEIGVFETLWLPKLKDVQRVTYLFPMSYFLSIRRDFFSLLSYRIPALFVAVIISAYSQSHFLVPVLFWLVFICAYEIGYMHNDIVSVRKENNPSMRLKPVSVNWFFTIVLSRLFCGFLLSVVLASYHSSYIWLSIGLMFVVILLFTSHNLMPRFLRVSTYPHLKCSHLIVPFVANSVFSEVAFSVLLTYGFVETRKYIRKVTQHQNIANMIFIFHYLLLLLIFMFIDLDIATFIISVTVLGSYITFWRMVRK